MPTTTAPLETFESKVHATLAAIEAADHSSASFELMRDLSDAHPEAYYAVLCNTFRIACYVVGETCFAETAPKEDLSKWFISYEVGSAFDTQEPHAPLNQNFDTRAEAEKTAVQALGLEALFVRAEKSADGYRMLVD